MKVVHIITGLDQGGAESALFRLVTFKQSNVNHIVVSMMNSGKFGTKLKDEDILVHTLEMPRGHITISGLTKLWKLIRKEKPDVVQTWMYHADLIGGTIARLTGCSSVCWGVVAFNLHPKVMSQSTRFIIKLCALFSHIIPSKIITCADASIRIHQSIGYSRGKFVTIPLGFDLGEDISSNGNWAKRTTLFGAGKDEIVLGCVARWDPQKDHGNLLHALAILLSRKKSFKCVLVGTGMNYQNTALTELVSKEIINKDRLIMAGVVENISVVMSSFDLNILPSLGEAFPNVLAEAMACGTPCVTTDVGDAALIVGNTGWVVPPSNPDALANAIQEAMDEMEDFAKWNARKEACRKRIVENYSLEQMVESYNRVWNDAINDK